MSRPIIAIDGPAGSGKSTLASRLAVALGIPYMNTGLMYRALAARALAAGVDVDDEAALLELLNGIVFGLSEHPSPRLIVDGSEPGAELATSEVEGAVSHVARHPGVRATMRELQRGLGADGAVLEGRDIGSVVFPDADLKFFLVAAEEERAARRRLERGDRPEVAEALAVRDRRDARVNPFVAPPDAIEIDTSGLDVDSTFEVAFSVVRERLGDRI